MDKDAYDALPDTLTVREIRYTTPQPGRRTRVITLVTTLLDAEAYPAKEIALLYEQRWQIEVNFRHLKTTMKMEVLHCQTVDGVLKELYLYAIAYNDVAVVVPVSITDAGQTSSPSRIVPVRSDNPWVR